MSHLLTCTTCWGEGTVLDSEWGLYWSELDHAESLMGLNSLHFQKYDEWVQEYNKEHLPTSSERALCIDCHGTGKNPTVTGMEIIEILNWWRIVNDQDSI